MMTMVVEWNIFQIPIENVYFITTSTQSCVGVFVCSLLKEFFTNFFFSKFFHYLTPVSFFFFRFWLFLFDKNLFYFLFYGCHTSVCAFEVCRYWKKKFPKFIAEQRKPEKSLKVYFIFTFLFVFAAKI